MLDFVCRGLKEVAGVKSLNYRFVDGNTPLPTGCVMLAETMRVFPIKYNAVTYAELNFEIEKSEAFEPYIPFLQNFVNMLGVVFEGQTQRKLNETLMEELEQRVAERTIELQEKEEDLRITLNSIGDAVISTDVSGNVTNMNPVAEKLTGWKLADGIGKRLTDVFRIVNVVTLQPALNPVKRVLATGEIVGLANHTSLIAKDGTHYQINDSAAPIRDIDGGICGVVLVFRDVTEEYRIAEALKSSEEKYREIVEKTGDLVTSIDGNGMLTYVNHRVEKVFGLPVDQCIGKSAFDCIHPEDQEKTIKWFSNCISNHIEQSSFENRQVNQVTQEITQLLWTSSFHYDDKDRLLWVNSLAHDITERKKAEEDKIKLEGQLQQAQKMEAIGQLAGGVAHDFNNMLGVILGHAEMAMEGVDPSRPLYADLEEIRKAATRSADITRQLLAFARKQTIAPKVLDLNQTVGSMLKMLQRLIGEGIDLVWQPGENLWPVKMDPSQVDQILANLCVNARDAIGDTGKLTIETSSAQFDQAYCADHAGFVPGEYVLLAVSDDGCGMDKKTQDKLFEPFFTTKEMGKGTGLGLATVYGIVKQNNGFINVYSEPGHGTTFKIYLTKHADHLDKVSAVNPDEPDMNGHETILVVEDEPAILKMTTKMLERLGYTVVAASSPAKAIRLAKEHHSDIHLLITDVVMPEMNGRDLAKNIQTLYPNIKHLFMSGYTANVIAHHSVLDKGVEFIQKPFSRKDLAVKVRGTFGVESAQ